jgi:hypothetical protein
VKPIAHRGSLAAISLGIFALGCGDDTAPPMDAAMVDAAGDSAPDGDADSGVEPASPSSPVFTPCPDGWREVTADGAPTVCDPFPASGPEECATDEAHFPGTPGCAPVTTSCPADGFPSDLPAGATVLFVDAASSGGDGTRAMPFATIEEAIAAAPDDAIVAVAPGMYPEELNLTRPVTVWGACADVRIGGSGFAFDVQTSGASVRNLTIWGVTTAFLLRSESELSVRDSIVRDTRQEFVQGNEGGSITLERVALRRVGRGIVHHGPGRIVLREVELRESSLPLALVSGAELVLEDVSLLGGTITAFFPSFLIADDATTTIERLYATDLERTNLQARGGSLEVRDSIIRGRSPSAMLEDDLGIIALGGVTATLERVRLENVHSLAAGAVQDGTTLTVSDVWVRDPELGADSGRAEALELGLGATGIFDRVRADGCRGACVLITDTFTTVSARDLQITEVMGGIDGSNGRALQVQSSARLDGERIAISGAREIALVAAGGDLDLEDLAITGTLETDCAPACPPGGIGLGAYETGTATITRFRIADGALAGVQVAVDGAIDLSDGFITGHPIGANVQVEGFDVARLQSRVVYDNDINLDATALPVPEPTLGL